MNIHSLNNQPSTVPSRTPAADNYARTDQASQSKSHANKNIDGDEYLGTKENQLVTDYGEKVRPQNDSHKDMTKTDEAENNPVNTFKDQLDEFQAQIRRKLLDTILDSVDPATKAILQGEFANDHVLYQVDEGVEAAEVSENWNAENTSQRIVDFAMSFAGEDADPEFLHEIRNAVMEGFAQAKEVLGNIPGESGKLFNETYESAMSKFDAILEGMNSEPTLEEQISGMTSQEIVAQSPYSQPYPTISAPQRQLDLAA